MEEQLRLPINLRDDATFENFFQGPNAQVVQTLQRNRQWYYLWGNSGVGCSHLLQACCHRTEGAVYLPLAEMKAFDPTVLINLEQQPLICIDDIHLIAGLPAWEEAIFHLYNRGLTTATQILFSANCAPHELTLQLPDLISRLAACMIFHVQALDDYQKIQALQLRAKYRGLHLPENVGVFLLRRFPRNMHDLFHCLEQLIGASLRLQKRLTVPLARAVLIDVE